MKRALLAAITLVLTAACGIGDRPDPNHLTMTVWTSDQAQLRAFQELGDAFAATRPGVAVRIQSVPQTEYVTKLSVRLAGGDPPDLGWLGAPDAVSMAAKGRLADVGRALREDPGYHFDDYVPAAFTNWRSGDAVYGIPFSTSPFFTIYNKDMLARAGLPEPAELAARGEWTWARMAELTARLKPTLPPGSHAFESNEGGMYGPLVWATLDPLLRAHGTVVYQREDRSCRLADRAAVEAIGLYHRMAFAEGTATPPGSQPGFYAGKTAITITQLSRLSQLQGSTFGWGVAPLPAGPGGQPHVTGQAGMVVFRQSDNPKLATELLKFLSERASTERLAQFYPPARRSVLAQSDRLYAKSPAVTDILVRGITDGEAFAYPENWPQIRATAEPALDKLWTRTADVPGVLQGICDRIGPMLRSKR
ncbi:sugar ABC transporter substrate-binding protein [Allokutzneria sp. A3M-2-11 16]|uniref:ABC transporter substrate-binding protein n=1 Tax=Allokutzneria sp. A3M-2-11 16 TaxID=2962043 RepID=UPI0020B64F5F|nr:sugar ABC transporter substrate-binding protein [Allokutzneria sp. A3M-2-11 16]MCP3798399.1 sugar ABC transporter substrate-binding protein [Allokutzneria sp. A3M-2-11 16]